MTNRVLTAAEQAYVSTLARRILYLEHQAAAIKHLPLEDIHEETGLPVFVVICWLADAAACTSVDMEEALG